MTKQDYLGRLRPPGFPHYHPKSAWIAWSVVSPQKANFLLPGKCHVFVHGILCELKQKLGDGRHFVRCSQISWKGLTQFVFNAAANPVSNSSCTLSTGEIIKTRTGNLNLDKVRSRLSSWKCENTAAYISNALSNAISTNTGSTQAVHPRYTCPTQVRGIFKIL